MKTDWKTKTQKGMIEKLRLGLDLVQDRRKD